MFKNLKKKVAGIKSRLKSVGTWGKALALSFGLSVLSPAVTFAQNAAGDYTAGTTALTTVAEEIAKYVPIVVKLCYAIAGVVAIIGAISVYIAIISTLFLPQF